MHANTSLARLPALFKDAGVQSSGLAFKDKVLHQTNALNNRYVFPQGALSGSVHKMANAMAHAQQHCQPDFLISNDEVFIKNALKLRRNLKSLFNQLNNDQSNFLSLLERSFATDDTLYGRVKNLELVAKVGFNTPDSFSAASFDDLRSSTEAFGYPYYLKQDFEGGGMGVSLITNDQDLHTALTALSKIPGQFSETNPLLAQRPTTGTEFTVNFASWQGELLGYDVIQPLQKTKQNGPSSVVKTLYRPAYEDKLRALVRELDYSGFGGLDVFENGNQEIPDVIEINLRPTHSLQLAVQLGSHLIQKFANRLNDTPDQDSISIIHEDKSQVATVFPDELHRDINSQYAVTTPSNIPWNDSRLLTVFLNFLKLN